MRQATNKHRPEHETFTLGFSDRAQRRDAFVMFEVVLALSIFLGAIAVLTQVLNTGSRAAIRAQKTSQAELICEQQMNKVLAGIEAMESVSNSTVGEDAKWTWSLVVSETDIPYLMRLEVTIKHDGGMSDSKIETKLVRYQRDPAFFTLSSSTESETL